MLMTGCPVEHPLSGQWHPGKTYEKEATLRIIDAKAESAA
jgi:hypothetical protein